MSLQTSIDTFQSPPSLSEKLKQSPQLFKPDIVAQLNANEQKEFLFCIRSNESNCMEASVCGGKGSSLAILNSIKGVEVPPFFCISTNAFKKTCNTTLAQPLENLQRLSGGQNFLADAQNLREAILSLPLPPAVEKDIRNAYEALCQEVGKQNVNVAVRSSATTEDTATASFAGQHDTFLFQSGIEAVLQSVKKCWSSVFTDRAVEYRNDNKIEHKLAVMAVVVQVMVSPDVAGTAFSVELSTQFPAVHINCCYGLGEAIVNGSVTGDELLVSETAIIKQVRGAKKKKYVPQPEGGIKAVKVEKTEQAKLCMETHMAHTLAKTVRNIQTCYKLLFEYDEIDTEFAMSNSQLYMLQARPVVPVSNLEVR